VPRGQTVSGQSTPAEQPLDARSLRVAIVAARYHPEITGALVDGALRCLKDAGAPDVDISWVPGAFELPLASQTVARAGAQAVVAVGCIIRGDTPHFEVVARESASGLMRVMLETHVPIGNAILTVETLAQAAERSDATDANKGWEAAASAIEMATFVANRGASPRT
jgi:6,7-dimethyl-8-ribityllumazine synthase